MKCYAYLGVRKLCVTLIEGWPCTAAAANRTALTSYAMFTMAFCCSECCVSSELELLRLVAMLYIIARPILQQICCFVVKCTNTLRAIITLFHISHNYLN